MSAIIKLPMSAVDFLFSQLNSVEYKVTWMRSPDYARQLYVGPNYQRVWASSPNSLYEHPQSWNDTLAGPDRTKIVNELLSRNSLDSEFENTVFYTIFDKIGNLKFVKDSCFQVFDQSGQQVAVAGVGEAISQRQWEAEIHQYTELKSNKKTIKITNSVVDIFANELKHNRNIRQLSGKKSEYTSARKVIVTSQGETVHLTKREFDCLHHLSVGQSAKQIARNLAISPRTVESHINNIKCKLSCRTSIELIYFYNGFSY